MVQSEKLLLAWIICWVCSRLVGDLWHPNIYAHLTHCDAIWQHVPGSTLAQVMARWHQAITWNNFYLSWVRWCGINLTTISQKMLKVSLLDISSKLLGQAHSRLYHGPKSKAYLWYARLPPSSSWERRVQGAITYNSDNKRTRINKPPIHHTGVFVKCNLPEE